MPVIHHWCIMSYVMSYQIDNYGAELLKKIIFYYR